MISLLGLEISIGLGFLKKENWFFWGKSKEIERKTKGFDKILKEKFGFERDLEEEKKRAHKFSKKPLVYFY